jgi:hypothetical protein
MPYDASEPRAAWALELPKNEREIDDIHRARKRVAIERARRSSLLRPRVRNRPGQAGGS